jgi:hypothetical protein
VQEAQAEQRLRHAVRERHPAGGCQFLQPAAPCGALEQEDEGRCEERTQREQRDIAQYRGGGCARGGDQAERKARAQQALPEAAMRNRLAQHSGATEPQARDHQHQQGGHRMTGEEAEEVDHQHAEQAEATQCIRQGKARDARWRCRQRPDSLGGHRSTCGLWWVRLPCYESALPQHCVSFTGTVAGKRVPEPRFRPAPTPAKARGLTSRRRDSHVGFIVFRPL